MKAKLLRETESINPIYRTDSGSYNFPKYKKHRRDGLNHPLHVTNPIGTEIDDPDCWRLVRCGVAEPLDDECRNAAGMTSDQITQLTAEYERLETTDITEEDDE
jgi:hypothetical protein